MTQGTFYKTGSTTDEGNKPHPENCTRTTGNNCNCHACNVTNAYTRCSRNTKCLERRNITFANVRASSLSNQTQHFFYATDLYEAAANGEPYTQPNQHYDQNVGPQPTIKSVNNVRNKFHVSYSSPKKLGLASQRNLDKFAALTF